MNNKGITLLKTAIAVLLLIFLGYQIYSTLYKPITTATAVYYNTYAGVDITGYFIRDEKIIDYAVTGTERYVATEGEKVAKDGTVAEVYATADMASAHEKVDDLKEQIATLEAINSVSDPSSVDLTTISNRINRAYIDLITSVDKNENTELDSKLNELLMLINKKQILTGEVGDFNKLLISLKAELATLEAGLAKPTVLVTTDTSGYFVPQTDGLESVLKVDGIEKIDESIFERIASTKPTGGFGKIVSSQNWYIIARMENDEYLSFSEGDSLKLKTPLEGCSELNVKVHKINVSKDKNAAVIILSCNTMNGQIALTRSAPLTIVTKEYSGIRISNEAVRVVDGVTGVYIVQGSVVKFRPIEIIYATETFTLCKKSEDGNSTTIRLYDEVIEKGKDLYDGKYIG